MWLESTELAGTCFDNRNEDEAPSIRRQRELWEAWMLVHATRRIQAPLAPPAPLPSIYHNCTQHPHHYHFYHYVIWELPQLFWFRRTPPISTQLPGDQNTSNYSNRSPDCVSSYLASAAQPAAHRKSSGTSGGFGIGGCFAPTLLFICYIWTVRSWKYPSRHYFPANLKVYHRHRSWVSP